MQLDFQAYAAILFIALMVYFLYTHKNKIQLQKIAFPFLYFAMYRTSLGLGFMEKTAKKLPRVLKWIAYAGIAIGFLGMVFISYSLISNLARLFMAPSAVAGVALVLPFKVKGSFYVPFFYWIISIFLLAVVHEFSHGIIARVYNIKLKSSGFAFLGIIVPVVPAAFVEPDEKELERKSAAARLSVFAAGPFSNILFAAVIALVFWLLFTPLASAIFVPDGVQVSGYVQSQNMTFPAQEANISIGEVILKVNGIEVPALNNFTSVLNSTRPGQQVSVETNRTTYLLTLAEDPVKENRSYLGIYVKQKTSINGEFESSHGKILTLSLIWVMGLFYWLYVLNLGIGLFNLVPIGPIDGGRMVHVVLTKYLREDLAIKVWKFISLLFFFIIVASLLFAFVK